MEVGKRYTKHVTLVGWGPGQTVRTATFGAEFTFETEDREILRWDTMVMGFEVEEGSKMEIGFTVKEDLGKGSRGLEEYEVQNVRRKGGK